jgi:hypothetical protein
MMVVMAFNIFSDEREGGDVGGGRGLIAGSLKVKSKNKKSLVTIMGNEFWCMC